MIDWLIIAIALIIIAILVGFFGFLTWKINMSDPLIRDNNNQYLDSINDKKKKDKYTTEQTKKKRKDQKKFKRENKDEQQQQRNKSSKELTIQTSEETDDEREESEQELLTIQPQTIETSSKARKRNKNKTHTTTPPPSSSSTHTKNNIKDEKNLITTRVPPVTHPKLTSKDELEPTKQQIKSSEISNKQTLSTSSSSTTTKKSTQSQQEQPFTIVGSNRHKTATPPLQQQNKSQVNIISSMASVQQSSSVQHDQLAQRQQLPQKETPIQTNVIVTNPLPLKQQQISTVPPKIADLIKILPSSQIVVTELMSALDAFPLSTDELDIIMHKIANKQSVIKQDWSKLQHGQKVDPQAHIGQVMDESAKAYEDDMKNNSMKHIKELTDELNKEKHRYNDLLKEKNEIEILYTQLNSIQSHPQQQKIQTLELQLKRITEENIHLNHQLTQQQFTSSNLQIKVLSDQIKKLSVDNANWEKKSNSNELLAKEAQKEKEDLIRYNEQLTQSLENTEKDLKHIEEKHHKQLNEYKYHIKQLENDNEQLRREEIIHIEPTITINNNEREQLEKEINQLKQIIHSNQQEFNDLKQNFIENIEEYKIKINNLQIEYQSQENELQQNKKIEQQKIDESRHALQTELNEIKSINLQLEEHFRQERDKQRQILIDLLPENVRNQLSNDNRDFDQWLSSYRQLFESNKQILQEESAILKRENDRLYKNMTDIENQLKEIEKTVQSKEEILLIELKNKDTLVENIRNENEQLNGELQRLQKEIQHLQTSHDASVSEAHALKLQLDERLLIGANSPSIIAADESFELVKQPSPSLSPIVIDIRAEQFNELIRSSKEALENQDSITQQLDKHLNDIHRSGTGETSASNVNESTVSSSSDQQS